jgi:hypothetical protein
LQAHLKAKLYMRYGFYLYGIFPLPGPQKLELEGLDKQPVKTHIFDDFVFLYSEAKQQRYLASRRNLLGHETVLEEAMHAGYRTVLPLKFGTIAESWQAVEKELLVPHRQQLHELLKQLTGNREVGIKIFWETNEELQRLLDLQPELKAKRDNLQGKVLSMEETIAIGQELERSLEAQKQGIIDRFHHELNALAIDRVENDPLTEAMIYNAAYLIPWDRETEFGDRVEGLDRAFEGRLRIRYNNFTAPFNFARLNSD